MIYKIQKGKEGENFVTKYLQKQGYKVITQNYQKKCGEIDIIAHKNDVLAFIEVKWRRNSLVDPAELIPLSKQKKIITVAKLFLSQHTYIDTVCRFDVALVEEINNTIELRYIPNAFTICD